MKLFKCTHCGQLLYFENSYCENCGYQLGFDADTLTLLSLQKDQSKLIASGEANSGVYRYCHNFKYAVCNWLVPDTSTALYCKACMLNRTIPNLGRPEYVTRWKIIEDAKHRLIYAILRMKLPLMSKTENKLAGLSFDFIADEGHGVGQRILTGHDDGLITINIAEADHIEREMARKAMDELYRTVLGHFRHESGHYYWDRLIADSDHLADFRRLFGDERRDYAEALKLHYKGGPPQAWNLEFISAYSTSHPWEDWAESWAHYLHIVDTLETAYSFGLSVQPGVADVSANLIANIKVDPYHINNFSNIIQLWFPLTFAMNSLNRSMGLQDLYPFVIRPKVIEKMSFIHSVCKHYGEKIPDN